MLSVEKRKIESDMPISKVEIFSNALQGAIIYVKFSDEYN